MAIIEEILLRAYLFLVPSQGGPRGRDFALKAVLGQIVMTKYNKKMYRVDDIDFDQNCKSTFKVCDF